MTHIQNYIDQINKAYQKGNATEHTYRTYLQQLIENLYPNLSATNEPQRIACGAPDYIIMKKDIPVGYIEAKDIGRLEALTATEKKQHKRYTESLDNLIYTDYLDFIFYKNGEEVARTKIAEVEGGSIKSLQNNSQAFENLLREFCFYQGSTIKSANKLATMMADKAKIMSDVITKALTSDEETMANSTLKEQLHAFRNILIHDIKAHEFADVYAQTIAYGMFAARLHDPTLDNFSRQEAAELIPKTNPFLRKLFGYIAGPEIDDRIKWVVDALAELFSYTNVAEIMAQYGHATRTNDPIVHFYETFLAEYDPALRKARGVWYTPAPIVDFIVRAVDDILKTDFNLPMGLADTSKTKVKLDVQGKKQVKELHKVQLLDPATGTGTFLAQVIKQIHKNFEGQQGIWKKYVDDHLIPRIHGFELLMASYTMAHLKLDLVLRDTGYNHEGSKRFQVYLTNSLEEAHPDTGTLFASWLSQEANEANYIKRDVPVMVVLGNPPYSGESSNKGDWIMKLMEDYKQEPGGGKLQERNPKWINDDYVKFIRFAQHYIDKNSQGVVGFITNHGYLDNPTFRGMRYSLLKTFDKIYIMDLHGNSKKKETAPDGSKDENVFDIMAGVAIMLSVKTGEKKPKELAKVYHKDLYGKRNDKYKFCSDNDINSAKWSNIKYSEPNYYFVKKDFKLQKEYEEGFSVNELFPINGVGMTTAHDDFVIADEKEILVKRFMNFKNSDRNEDLLHRRFNVNKKKGWDILKAWDKFQTYSEEDIKNLIKPVTYRPFQNKYIIYEDTVVWRTVRKVMKHMLRGDNLGLITARSNKSMNMDHFFITNNISETKCGESTTQSALFPLYLYPDEGEMDQARRPNLDENIINNFAYSLDLGFSKEKNGKSNIVLDSNTFNVLLSNKEKINELKNKYHFITSQSIKFEIIESKKQELIDIFNLINPEIINYGILRYENKPKKRANNSTFGINVPFIPGSFRVSEQLTADLTQWKKGEPNNKDVELYKITKHSNAILITNDNDLKDACKQNRIICKNIVDLEHLDTFAPIDVLDYIYGVLHSPSYREKYKEFLKIDFPRVPYPKNAKSFFAIGKIGSDLCQLHLMEHPALGKLITKYPVNGDNVVDKPRFEDGKVYINAEQYFEGVPAEVWNFYIGGYQVAHKWLKDRKGRELSFDDILHYQKIIVSLSETIRLMKEVDKIIDMK